MGYLEKNRCRNIKQIKIKPSKTVQVFIPDQDFQKALLVHELGDDEPTDLRFGVRGRGKRPGTGMPGGWYLQDQEKDVPEEELWDLLIRNRLPVETKIGKDDLYSKLESIVSPDVLGELFPEEIKKHQTIRALKIFLEHNYNSEIDRKVWMIAMLECAEETGFLVLPTKYIFEENNSPTHKVVVLLGEVIGGIGRMRTTETDGYYWTNLEQLPKDTYYSHKRRIVKALEVLGQNDMASRVRKIEDLLFEEAV